MLCECEICTSWNTPKTYVDLNSLGVVVLDTTVVPDVIGLHASCDEEAALVRVLPSVSPNIVLVLVSDDCAKPWGFHNLLIEDMSDTIVRPTSAGDLTALRQHWPLSLLSGMTKYSNTSLSPHELSSGFRSAVAVPDSMVWKGTTQDCVDHLRFAPVTLWVVHEKSFCLHPTCLCRSPLGGQTWPGF